ncbi:NAD(P)-dependent dehydrogenase (short-subunit alcohol dehydrogenase family) [Solibacillus kalamii]|uniref:2-hydroxypropyl-CoM dehydrogenase n=1 Tax=Solibacillus kalamii TaxID=1748298 RepID=A0ABX3ZEK8_9BACL|nr:SDR family NAD(P)-dependent oxidoreductase [Solibacillus kalamii]MBM7666494.1 NAD(P)-dependent dehydrogenase (short-subunit alcohol dehydrogenase family) [Solibacillus kalamii]OUZ37914.1 2-hydroxypropyl-CoM dehydrogenase [Solibacillus kalamii]
MRLQNKVAIITGAASGMGQGEAIRFAKEGAKVVVADLNFEGAQAVAEEIKAAGGEAIAVSVNVMKTEDILNCIKVTEETFGSVDVLVNNAGVFDKYQKSLETTLDQWKFLIDINLTSMFEFCNAVLPSMIERQTGAIVNICSVAGLVAGKGGAAYTASKHGAIGYTKHLSSEYARYGIKINAICPGTIETPLVKDVLAGLSKEAVPTRTFGQVEEVADLAVFLASDEAKFMSGTAVTIDGGFTIQ